MSRWSGGLRAARTRPVRRSTRSGGGSFGLPSIESRRLAPRNAVNAGDSVEVVFNDDVVTATVGKVTLSYGTTFYRVDFDDRHSTSYRADELARDIRKLNRKSVSGRRLQLELNDGLDMTATADARRRARDEASVQPSRSRLATPPPDVLGRRKRAQLASLSSDAAAPRVRRAARTPFDTSAAGAAHRSAHLEELERLRAENSQLKVDLDNMTSENEGLRKTVDEHTHRIRARGLEAFAEPHVDPQTVYFSAAWTEADGAKIFEAALNAQLGDQNETCRAMRILGAHIHNVVVRKEALQCETPVHDIAGALERAVLSPDATGALLWGLATGWNDDPQKFIEDEGHNLDEAYQRRYLLATWVAKEVLLKAVNPNRAHALPAFLSGVLADNSARRSMMNLFVVLGLARSNKHEVRSERARVEIQGCPTFSFEPHTLNVLIFDNLGFTRNGPQDDGEGRYSHWVNMAWLCFGYRRLLEIGALDASTERTDFAAAFATKKAFVDGVVPRDGYDPSTSRYNRSAAGREFALVTARAAAHIEEALSVAEDLSLQHRALVASVAAGTVSEASFTSGFEIAYRFPTVEPSPPTGGLPERVRVPTRGDDGSDQDASGEARDDAIVQQSAVY